MLYPIFFNNILTQITTQPSSNTSTFSWEMATTILGVAALIIGSVIKIFADNYKSKSEISGESIKQINDVTNQLNTVTNRVNDLSSKIAVLEVENKNLVRDNEEMKSLVRDIEKDNFNALNKVVDKVDHIKDMLIEKLNKK